MSDNRDIIYNGVKMSLEFSEEIIMVDIGILKVKCIWFKMFIWII